MSKAAHTPGPWEAAGSHPWDGFDYIKILAGGREIASVVGPQADEEIKATAAVMAAAPDLLAIAKGVVGMLENCIVESGVCCCGDSIEGHAEPLVCGHMPCDSGAYYSEALRKDARAAIAKAEGA